MRFLLSVLSVLLISTASYSECCGVPFGGHYQCKDGSWTWTCCGKKGKSGCNIFCCHCDGGCRQPGSYEECVASCDRGRTNCEDGCEMTGNPGCSQSCDKMYSDCVESCRGCCNSLDKVQSAKKAIVILHTIDSKDSTSVGTITVDEFAAFFKDHPCVNAKKEFKKVDKDKNRIITIDEIDNVDLNEIDSIDGIDDEYLKQIKSTIKK